MVAYIQELAATIQIAKDTLLGEGVRQVRGLDVPDIHSLFAAFAEEVDRLDPLDFEPAIRHDFVILRVSIRNRAKGRIGDAKKAAAEAKTMATILDKYVGQGSGAVTRALPFITNADVRKIVERDYRELDQRAFPDGSWKSAVILAGSILEAVLHDILTKDAAAIAAATASVKAPKKKGGVKDISKDDYENQWTLNDLIKVSCDLKILPFADEMAIHHVLREYRNLVHPRVEIALGISISEAHATASKGMLDVILDSLT